MALGTIVIVQTVFKNLEAVTRKAELESELTDMARALFSQGNNKKRAWNIAIGKYQYELREINPEAWNDLNGGREFAHTVDERGRIDLTFKTPINEPLPDPERSTNE